MPEMPVNTIFGYFGVMAFLFGVFLILSGTGIIRIVDISIQAGQKTLIFGIVFILIGVGLMYVDINGLPSSNPQVTSVSELPNGTATPMVVSSEPKIVIDDSRECGESLTWEKANRINPEHPEYSYAGDLAIEIQKLHTTYSVISEKPINTEKLTDYRVLILLSSCDGYSLDEIVTIENFVRSGGRLLVLGSIDNFLLSQFGIRYLGTPVELDGAEYDWEFQIPVNSSDPILKGIPDLPIHSATVLEVQDPSNVILWMPKNAYLDANINRVHESAEKQGSFPMVIRMEYGKGYIVFTANRPIWTFGFSNNYVLVFNALEWLLNQ